MNVSQAAARVYARALFEIGVKEKTVGSIHDELHAVDDALQALDPELQTFFNMPHLRRDEKLRIFKLAFEGKVSRTIMGLLTVLVRKRREPLFDNIVEEFDRYSDEHEGRVRARVTSARKLDTDLADELRAVLEEQTKKSVLLQEVIDPEVLGGIRVSLGDRVLDGTVRRGLQDMRRSLFASQRQG